MYETFVGDIADGMVIDHINSIRHDNRFDNLRVITSEYNVKIGSGSHRGSIIYEDGIKKDFICQKDARVFLNLSESVWFKNRIKTSKNTWVYYIK